MTQSGPLPYLDVSGVEVANAARTVSYLRRGLGETLQGHWEIGGGSLCSVLYRTSGSPSTFVSPVSDPAPWYNADEPGSATFLGLILLDIKGYDSTLYRTVQRKTQGLGGAVFSQQYRQERVFAFRGALVSSDDAGAEYGLRWLTQTLRASSCDDCATGSLTIRIVCPPDNGSDDTLGEWTAYDVALVEGPKEVEPWAPKSQSADTDVLAGCRDYVICEFTLTAGNPFLYKPAVTAMTASQAMGTALPGCGTIYGAPGAFYLGSIEPASDDYEVSGVPLPAVSVAVTPPKQGTVGAVFKFDTTVGMGLVYMEARAPGCNTSGEPILRLALSEVPANSTVVVNCANHTVTVTNSMGTFDGGYLITLPPDRGIEWIEAAACDDIGCFCARPANDCSGGLNTTVLISTQLRDG